MRPVPTAASLLAIAVLLGGSVPHQAFAKVPIQSKADAARLSGFASVLSVGDVGSIRSVRNDERAARAQSAGLLERPRGGSACVFPYVFSFFF